LVLNSRDIVELRVLNVDRSISLKTLDPSSDGTAWLVSGGLEEGDRLIVEGVQKVRPGGPAVGRVVSLTGFRDSAADPR
jgi:membrane fusion protein (multidrug efflux system)